MDIMVLGAEVATVNGALKSAMTDVATQCTTAITDALPVALPVMGAIVVVSVGIRIFKKVTGR